MHIHPEPPGKGLKLVDEREGQRAAGVAHAQALHLGSACADDAILCQRQALSGHQVISCVRSMPGHQVMGKLYAVTMGPRQLAEHTGS